MAMAFAVSILRRPASVTKPDRGPSVMPLASSHR
jgi:hypothetical protein